MRLLWAAGRDSQAVERGIEHFHHLYGDLESAYADHADSTSAAEEGLRQTGTMTVELTRAFERFVERVRDEHISSALQDLRERLSLGAVRQGLLSAATMKFPDASHLLLVDHGLAALTWFAAGMAMTTLAASQSRPPQALQAPAHAFRLATSRLAVGGRAGICPPIVLDAATFGPAGTLTAEMDVFVLAHEISHILLGHLGNPGKGMGIVGGHNELLGKAEADELAADNLALLLMFDDVITEGEVSDAVAAARLGGVRLFLTVLEEYETASFLIAPTTHPPARARWDALRRRRLDGWFPDLDERLAPITPFLDDLAAIKATRRSDDIVAVHEGLAAMLDPDLWSFEEWSDIGQVARMICSDTADATEVIAAWQRRNPDVDASAFANRAIHAVLESQEVRTTLTQALREGTTITRLQATTMLMESLPTDDHVSTGYPRDPFPGWAISLIAQDAIATAAATRADARDDGRLAFIEGVDPAPIQAATKAGLEPEPVQVLRVESFEKLDERDVEGATKG